MISDYDSHVYILNRNEKIILYLLLSVNNIFMVSSIKDEIGMLKEKINYEFEIKDLNVVERIIEMDIVINW